MAVTKVGDVQVITTADISLYNCTVCHIWRQVGERVCPVCGNTTPRLPGDNANPKLLTGANAVAYLTAMDEMKVR